MTKRMNMVRSPGPGPLGSQ